MGASLKRVRNFDGKIEFRINCPAPFVQGGGVFQFECKALCNINNDSGQELEALVIFSIGEMRYVLKSEEKLISIPPGASYFEFDLIYRYSLSPGYKLIKIVLSVLEDKNLPAYVVTDWHDCRFTVE